jgi:hypothetical protein
VLQGDFVGLEEALSHPHLEEPCAFVNGVRLAPLLTQLGGGQRAEDILHGWCEHLSPPAAERVLNWLWEIEAISPVEAQADSQHAAERQPTYAGWGDPQPLH